MSQLFAFLTACRNSFTAWIRREIVNDDPWDDQPSEPPSAEEPQKTAPMEPTVTSDLPQSSGSTSKP